MTVTLHEIAGAVQTLLPSKWHWNITYLAHTLGITVEETNGFIRCIEKGGTGNKKEGSWRPNPDPFAAKTDLTQSEENSLNLHYTDVRNEFSRLDNVRFVRLGKISSQNKSITVSVQKEIAKFVMGTHKTLTTYYPDWADFRQKNWRSWIETGRSADQYQMIHLPYIAVHFCDVWDVHVAKGMNPRDITPTVLGLVKNEIVEMMVCMDHLPASMMQSLILRRSRRNMAVRDDVEIVPVQRKRARLTPSPAPSPETDDDENDKQDGEVLRQFDLGALKSLWKHGDQKEVGRREIALVAAHADKSYRAACLEISALGGMPHSVDEYESIQSISKSDLSKKRGNFDKLRAWINDSLPFEHMRVRDGQLLLEFARTVE